MLALTDTPLSTSALVGCDACMVKLMLCRHLEGRLGGLYLILLPPLLLLLLPSCFDVCSGLIATSCLASFH